MSSIKIEIVFTRVLTAILKIYYASAKILGIVKGDSSEKRLRTTVLYEFSLNFIMGFSIANLAD